MVKKKNPKHSVTECKKAEIQIDCHLQLKSLAVYISFCLKIHNKILLNIFEALKHEYAVQ